MGNQTIKLNGLEEYSPITAALQEHYNSLQTNISKRRLMYNSLRNGYALEVMGLGGLVELLARQDFMAMPEAERRARFIAMANALTGNISVNQAAPQAAPPATSKYSTDPDPVKPTATVKPEMSTDESPVPPPAETRGSAASSTHNDDEMMTTRVEESLPQNSPSALKLNRTRKK
ncbi:hypothetical protein FR773_26120 (plasmid) [Leclercia adecarboxylata]|uniref:hypothetical protein n=1 Tax=Leclercia adecarboxylata TaxID=83655 RepID=UPI0012A90251|nr:hypothetical protein [Leclercia adecarboxylata]QFH68109.1 hypothetical protein FR773_26120 [Leclercia adecarboxylata]